RLVGRHLRAGRQRGEAARHRPRLRRHQAPQRRAVPRGSPQAVVNRRRVSGGTSIALLGWGQGRSIMRTFVSILAVLVLLVGLAPLADAQSQTVTGHITQVDVKNQVVKIRPQGGGAEVQLITTGIPADTIKALKVGDRVTATVRDNSTRKSGTMMDVTSIA